ncbi:PREDICTED: uncharacterized protein LOC108552883 [Eufriesea mexicana]|uniref:uncharacterized protein LOC108552883 n=1 Tax=Eufriesea mexicana TaxID=516756 RepID=UPI00083C2CA2|nr:PREDICTED: uncharacterized protein LOC108552883 [Eufriesea mexicana]
MKILLFGFCLVCLSMSRVQSKPQTTKLFPIPEETSNPPEEASSEAKPLDRLLGKLRATYNFVFRKPENTSNVEKILAKDKPDPDVEALKLIWSNRMQQSLVDREASKKSQPKGTYLKVQDDWVNDVQPLERLEPLEPLELEDEVEVDKDRDVEIITPRTTFQFPVTLSRHLVDWIGSLLGITYGVYSKLSRIVNTNHTAIRVK